MERFAFPIVVALLPLATYLILLGGMRLLLRPVITTGARDLAAVGVAVSGFVVIGPLQLFFPSDAAAQLGWLVWLILGMLYVLCVGLVVLALRPSIIVYGMRLKDALPLVLQAAKTIDDQASLDEASGQINLDAKGVHLRVDPVGITDAVQIESFERNLHPRFWRMLLSQLRLQGRSVRCSFSVGGLTMLLAGLMMLLLIGMIGYQHSEQLLASFRDWLSLSSLTP